MKRAEALPEGVEAPTGLGRAGEGGLKCGLMVFEYIIRHSPCRRASPCIAEGFSPTARAT